jgi:hypothetical protein
MTKAIGVLLVLGWTARAGAEDLMNVGVRVGGYGFREPAAAGGGWNDCRMNGIGVFADRALPRGFFVEGGLDAYFADDTVLFHDHGDQHAGGMDRVSGLLTVAGGIRFWPEARVSPYVQLGGGLEVTRVRMEDGSGHEQSRVFPLGFFGLGGDVRLGRVRLGATLRVHAMGHFAHEGGNFLEAEAELATQGQFHVKVSL